MKYLINPKFNRMVILFFIGSLFAINNLEFGIPAIAGALAAVIITSGKGLLPPSTTLLKISMTFIFSVGFALASFVGLTVLRSGQLPDWQRIIEYHRIFALYGNGMNPMPDWGMHWLIYITFMATVLLAVWKVVTNTDNHGLHPQRGLARVKALTKRAFPALFVL
jgi:hypothetical protein